MTWRTSLSLCMSIVAASAFAYACSSLDSSSLASFGRDPNANGGAEDAGAGGTISKPSTPELVPVDNAVILVHAAKSQSFRLCFEHEGKRLPQPDSQVMPEANVVGVEVGAAVRLPALTRGGPAGVVRLFEEPLIRALYPNGAGPTCDALLSSSDFSKLAITLGTIDADLSSGVHLIVVNGCPGNTALQTFNTTECGAGWDAIKGNLGVTEITLTGARRPDPNTTLPAQVVNLSQALEGTRAGRDLVITFGDLATPSAPLSTVTTNPGLYEKASPAEPAKLPLDGTNVAIYQNTGFRVSLVDKSDGGADAGPGSMVLDESLARIQKLSAPHDVPPTYYGAASNYALLLLGDPNAQVDGGPDTDERRSLHLLAVPVISPDAADGGAEGGAAADGGGATP